jgi:glycosyltransferase involved in cell wall biosynthesis
MTGDVSLVSVVIPTYNRKDEVVRSIISVFNQTYRPIEIIVVDDCSTDGTADFLQTQKFPGPVRVLRQPENAGPAVARNSGVAAAAGKYVAFLDSDDWWLPRKLERQMEIVGPLGSSQNFLIYTQAYLIRKHETIIRPQRAMTGEGVAEYVFCNSGHINTSSILVPTELVRRCRYDPQLRLHEDWDMYLRLEQSGVEFYFLNEPLTVTVDLAARGRASNPNPERSFLWVEQRKNLMSKRPYNAFRAKMAPDLRSVAPLKGIRLIMAAFLKRDLGLFITLSLLGRLAHPELRNMAYWIRSFGRRQRGPLDPELTHSSEGAPKAQISRMQSFE